MFDLAFSKLFSDKQDLLHVIMRLDIFKTHPILIGFMHKHICMQIYLLTVSLD